MKADALLEVGERTGCPKPNRIGAADIKNVGVMSDERAYQRPAILRAVESSDAMTADWAKLPCDVLARVGGRIVAEVPGVNRVVYGVTSKPPRRSSGNKRVSPL